MHPAALLNVTHFSSIPTVGGMVWVGSPQQDRNELAWAPP